MTSSVDALKAGRPHGRERRRQERMSLTLPVRVQGQYPDGETWEDMAQYLRRLDGRRVGEAREETTVADNLGPGGARIMTKHVFANGEIFEVREAGGSFIRRAAVRNAYVGEDSVWRLNLMFLDAPAPDYLMVE